MKPLRKSRAMTSKGTGKVACRTDLADALLWRLKVEGLRGWLREHRFHPIRRWRFDLARIDIKIAIEVHGGEFIRGGHSRGLGLRRDSEKSREAQLLGWMVLTFTGTEVTQDCGAVVDVIRRAVMLRT